MYVCVYISIHSSKISQYVNTTLTGGRQGAYFTLGSFTKFLTNTFRITLSQDIYIWHFKVTYFIITIIMSKGNATKHMHQKVKSFFIT